MDATASDDEDEALMRAYAAGDTSAFARLYDRHERPVHRFFLRQGIVPSIADELLQETWMAIVHRAATYLPDAKFTTWLYTIARSKLVDHWRTTKRHVPIDDAANDPDALDDGSPWERVADHASAQPEMRAMSRQQASLFVAAVEALPAAQREAFLLHVDGDLTMEQMAAATDVGVETLKSRLRYAMRRLRLACADWLEAPAGGISSAVDGARDEA